MDPSWEATCCVPPKSEALVAGGGRAWHEERVAKFRFCRRRDRQKLTGPFLHGVLQRLAVRATGEQNCSCVGTMWGRELVPWPMPPEKFLWPELYDHNPELSEELRGGYQSLWRTVSWFGAEG